MNIFKLPLHLFFFFANAVSTPFHVENLQFPYHLSKQGDFKQFNTAPNCFNPPWVSHSEKNIYLSTLYTQMTQKNMADPQLTKMILFNIFQIFQINKINFQQYLILHNHPETFIHKVMLLLKRIILSSVQKPFPEIYPIEHVLHWKKKI